MIVLELIWYIVSFYLHQKMDKSWLLAKRNTLKYEMGVEQFLKWHLKMLMTRKDFLVLVLDAGM
jgi:hypothetical protein